MTHKAIELSCPLCQTADAELFFQDKRDYYQCSECALVFVPPQQFISPEKEKAIYDLHENSTTDPGYRNFLKRFLKPVAKKLPPQSQGLDFGSGPGPLLAIMFEELGHNMVNYDCFYAPDIKLLKQQYDFITATEVIEHLHHPQQELQRLWHCLKGAGILGIMTKRVLNQQAFSHWHYKNDPTHVCFFSVETFQWLASLWQAKLIIAEKDVVIFIKPSGV